VDAADKESCRLDFAVALCPGHLYIDQNKLQLNPEIHVTRETPPAFLLQAEDDHLDDVNQSLVYYYIALKNAGVPVEMHSYAHGGHAFGLRPTKLPITRGPSIGGDLARDDRNDFGVGALGLRTTKRALLGSARTVWKIEDRVRLKEFRKWRSKELVHKLPPTVRQSGSLARYGSIRFSRHPIRHWFKAPA
jgi:hypothetical protein